MLETETYSIKIRRYAGQMKESIELVSLSMVKRLEWLLGQGCDDGGEGEQIHYLDEARMHHGARQLIGGGYVPTRSVYHIPCA